MSEYCHTLVLVIIRYKNVDASLHCTYSTRLVLVNKYIQMSKKIKRYQNIDTSLYLQYKAGVSKQIQMSKRNKNISKY